MSYSPIFKGTHVCIFLFSSILSPFCNLVHAKSQVSCLFAVLTQILMPASTDTSFFPLGRQLGAINPCLSESKTHVQSLSHNYKYRLTNFATFHWIMCRFVIVPVPSGVVSGLLAFLVLWLCISFQLLTLDAHLIFIWLSHFL